MCWLTLFVMGLAFCLSLNAVCSYKPLNKVERFLQGVYYNVRLSK